MLMVIKEVCGQQDCGNLSVVNGTDTVGDDESATKQRMELTVTNLTIGVER
jgi:hypothetical protein